MAGLAATAVYFAVASYLEFTYVPTPPPPNDQIWLPRPFVNLKGSSTGYVSISKLLDGWADSAGDPFRSPIIVYENGKALGPAHTVHTDIAKGSFSHWQGVGIIFSASDDSNPNINRKHYTISRPPS
jgi:hypothetical protein